MCLIMYAETYAMIPQIGNVNTHAKKTFPAISQRTCLGLREAATPNIDVIIV